MDRMWVSGTQDTGSIPVGATIEFINLCISIIYNILLFFGKDIDKDFVSMYFFKDV